MNLVPESHLQEVNDWTLPLFFIVTAVLLGLWFFLITGFVSVNVLLKLIVCNDF